MQRYVDEIVDKKNIDHQQNETAMVANFEESFRGLIAELLTK